MDLELQGKVALVTGGSGGIGKVIAMELAREGADVAVCARNRQALEAVAKQVGGETGRRAVVVTADSTKKGEVEQAVQEVIASLGAVDILINSGAPAGGLASGPLAAISDELVLEDFNIKYLGYLRFARAVAPSMQQRGFGRIINLGGLAARNAGSLSAGARNVAVVHMTKTLSDELGPFGITVNVVHPGSVRTERTAANLAARAQREGVSVEEIERQLSQNNAIRRIVDARDIAYVVTFLASPRAGAITGEVIAAGGGVGRAVYS